MHSNRLNNQRVYLAGAMDRVVDRGNGWRDDITPFLQNLGVIVFNPIKKPTVVGQEDEATHKHKIKLKAEKNYDELSKLMKTIRSVDLRLVDISDFMIANLDLDHYACGTWEELFLANRSKKPIVIHIEQGKQNAPDWLFGTIPHQMIFSTWSGVENYLQYIHTNQEIDHANRWRFFDI
jgi:nucleoside 2-deoxyribosyltransferase